MGIFSRKRPTQQNAEGAAGEPQFGLYVTTDAGRPASLMVDLSVHARAPISALPCFFGLHLPYDVETENAFPTSAQFDELTERGRLALDVASATLEHHFVGNVTTNGKRTLCFYVPSPDSLTPFIDALSSQVGPAVAEGFGYAVYPDAEWRTYLDDLYPDAEQMKGVRRS
ncbi:DUF695 domain-containing protein [Microbacterium istanbulense]|uniref:DUF695 domain-containing protein n=1 Tax=Microbacterium istanbulense TaxID=3122049 RepID=A0ABU8LGK5_9MICO